MPAQEQCQQVDAVSPSSEAPPGTSTATDEESSLIAFDAELDILAAEITNAIPLI